VVPLQIYRNIGGNFNAGPVTSGVNVGAGALSFSDCGAGQLTYSFNDGSGRSGVIPIKRLTPNVTCSAGSTHPTDVDFAYSGNWFNASTSGQGLMVEVNPVAPVYFFSWYTYARNGFQLGITGQRWYTGQGTFNRGQRSIQFNIYETTGGIFDQGTNPAPYTQAINAGTGTMTFTSCTRATMQFNFTQGANTGAAGTIQLDRLGPVPPGCN
jgi:hypothetical protein